LGIVVLAADSGRIDLEPLRTRLGTDPSVLIARLCSVGTPAAENERGCETGATKQVGDCDLAAAAACHFPLTGSNAAPVIIRVFERDGAEYSAVPVAQVAGIVTTRKAMKPTGALAEAYTHDLAALRVDVSADEFRALETAATVEIARRRF